MSKIPGPAKSTMARASEVLEFIRRGTKPSASQIAFHMQCDDSTARKYLAILRDLGKVTRVRTKGSRDNPAVDIYSIGEDSSPVVAVDDYRRLPLEKKRTMHNRGFLLPCERQITVKAVQIGMVRDELIAALFGPARSA